MLTRYWITFKERGELPFFGGVFGFGVGVTAHNIEDAKCLMKEQIFKKYDLPEIENIVENIEYDALDDGHVKPNMGTIVNRGIWFPKGFE